MITITFPDGKKKEYNEGKIPLEIISEDIGEGLARAALAVEFNSELMDLSTPLETDGDLKVITYRDNQGKDIFKHSAAHILAIAVKRLFPEAKLTIGPSVEDGFYYDIDYERAFAQEDVEKLEEEIKKIIKDDVPFKRKEINKEEALEIFSENEFKKEMISDLGNTTLTIYENGEFKDLCRGPHVPSTGKVKCVKLMKISGAFWRGDAKNKQLQRIYGVAFPDKKELNEYLKILEEAQKRDHRKIGKEMDLFSFHEEGLGFPFWHDKGMVIMNELIDFWRKEHKKNNYLEIKTPQILNRSLWETSGHWDLYKENMYTTKIDDQDNAIKPMNCPGGMLVYKEKVHSYRELPLKVGELGLVHRHEASGALSGLLRVRCFTQDDAHVFCTGKQLEGEIKNIIKLIQNMFDYFDFSGYKFTLSVRSEKKKDKYLGSDKEWDAAENALKKALTKMNLEFEIEEGEAKFYGPSLDVKIKDALKREWQCSTIQLDFNLAPRFNITYIGENGEKETPYILHRVVYGSLERFIGVVIEHYAGKFPLWLSPVQVKILPIADRHKNYCNEVKNKLFEADLRSEINEKAETTNKKVREAQLENVNYILVIGDNEIEANTVNVRTRNNEVKGEIKLDKFIEDLKKEVNEKR